MFTTILGGWDYSLSDPSTHEKLSPKTAMKLPKLTQLVGSRSRLKTYWLVMTLTNYHVLCLSLEVDCPMKMNKGKMDFCIAIGCLAI